MAVLKAFMHHIFTWSLSNRQVFIKIEISESIKDRKIERFKRTNNKTASCYNITEKVA